MLGVKLPAFNFTQLLKLKALFCHTSIFFLRRSSVLFSFPELFICATSGCYVFFCVWCNEKTEKNKHKKALKKNENCDNRIRLQQKRI